MRPIGPKTEITDGDIEHLGNIIECGFVFMSLTGDPWLQSGKRITAERVQRLVELGLLKSGEDQLITGTGPQTYHPNVEGFQNDERIQKRLASRSAP
jgi:hypothetical protein